MTKTTNSPALENESTSDAEAARIRAAYARRRSIPPARYAATDPFTLYSSHEREQEMAALFRSEGLTSLAGLAHLVRVGGSLELARDGVVSADEIAAFTARVHP